MPLFRLALLFGLLMLAMLFVLFGIVPLAFEKLGLSTASAYTLLITMLIGSAINMPLFRLESTVRPPLPPELQQPVGPMQIVIAVNLGGAVIPLLFSLFLWRHYDLALHSVLATSALVGAVAYAFSKPIIGIGIAMPILLTPIAAVLAATYIAPEQRAALAYVGGTFGVLLGADLLRFRDFKRIGAPFASIGGAGSFDGIFLTGVVAVLLA